MRLKRQSVKYAFGIKSVTTGKKIRALMENMRHTNIHQV